MKTTVFYISGHHLYLDHSNIDPLKPSSLNEALSFYNSILLYIVIAFSSTVKIVYWQKSKENVEFAFNLDSKTQARGIMLL